MRCVVTGVAGFIGSHLAERLLSMGHSVVGVDKLSDYYDPMLKKSNLVSAVKSSSFSFIQKDVGLLTMKDLNHPEIVFHLAAQPGVRSSWGSTFETYVADNVVATQKLLELCKSLKITRFVYASSSSVYGDSSSSLTRESDATKPISPYGVTKLAGENLCMLYNSNYHVPAVSLRFFTVYGPRQRPDMAFHKFIRAAAVGKPIIIFGDGNQRRDFTFVDDVVTASILSMEANCVGKILNIASGRSVKLAEALGIIEKLTGKTLLAKFEGNQKGDVNNTAADIGLAEDILSFSPRMSLTDGLRAEIEWLAKL